MTILFSDFVPKSKAEEMQRVALRLVGFHCGTAEPKVPQISLTGSHRHVLLAHGRANRGRHDCPMRLQGSWQKTHRILMAEGAQSTRPRVGLQASGWTWRTPVPLPR